MSILNYPALEAAPVTHDPFDYLVAPGFLQPDALERVRADYPEIDTPANLDPAKLRYGPAFQELLDEVHTPEFAAAVGKKFGVDLTNTDLNITVRKFAEASDGHIHTDHWSKVVTVLIYFNKDWTSPTGNLRMLRSSTDIEDYADEVKPLGGTLLAFRRSAKSYHGHLPYVGERLMMQLNFIKSGTLARAMQRIDRFATQTIKRITRKEPAYK